MNELNGSLDLAIRAYGQAIEKQLEVDVKTLVYLGIAGCILCSAIWTLMVL